MGFSIAVTVIARMFLISFATGFGLGFGFWTAHLFCKQIWKKRGRSKPDSLKEGEVKNE